MKSKQFLFWCTLFAALILVSCNNTKHLKPDEVLYTGATTKVDGKKAGDIDSEVSSVIKPEPNSTAFSALRIKLWLYNQIKEPKKDKGLRYNLKYKIGEPPVLMEQVDPERTVDLIKNRLINKGYFYPKVTAEVKTKKNEQKAAVEYTIKLGQHYTIKEVNYPTDSIRLTEIIREQQVNSLIRSGDGFNLDRLKEERSRLNTILKDSGYFYFNEDFLLWEIDSTFNGEVKVYLEIKNNLKDKALAVYDIKSIYINPNYDLSDSTNFDLVDTLDLGNVYYLEKDSIYRPRIISNIVTLKKDAHYNRNLHNLTLEHFTTLGPFKFVNINFKEAEDEAHLLNTIINLTPLPKKSLRGELSATSKSNNFVGSSIEASYTNRNFFRGAELFKANINFGFETQLIENAKGLNSYDIGTELELNIPRFISPFNVNFKSQKFLPKTVIKAGYRTLNRVQFYQMNSINASFGYRWKQKSSISHTLYPLNFTYAQLGNTTDEFEQTLNDNPTLRRSFEEQFILGTSYTIEYDSRLKVEKKHNYYLRLSAEAAGNTFHLGAQIINPENDGSYDILGLPFSQFVRSELTFKYHLNIDDNNRLVGRIIAGVGVPIGNSNTLPYIKQFFIGGSNSIRAFQARTLGPGTFQLPESNQRNAIFLDQSGDLKLEANLEYRFNIISVLKGALFADAGNVWLIDEDNSKPGGEFNIDDFYQEIAMGVGSGLRVDASFFVLRLDVAFPIRKPFLPENKRWTLNDIQLGDKDWRQDNLVFNIAIGYPF